MFCKVLLRDGKTDSGWLRHACDSHENWTLLWFCFGFQSPPAISSYNFSVWCLTFMQTAGRDWAPRVDFPNQSCNVLDCIENTADSGSRIRRFRNEACCVPCCMLDPPGGWDWKQLPWTKGPCFDGRARTNSSSAEKTHKASVWTRGQECDLTILPWIIQQPNCFPSNEQIYQENRLSILWGFVGERVYYCRWNTFRRWKGKEK